MKPSTRSADIFLAVVAAAAAAILAAPPAYAYVGPGLGFTVIGTILAVIAAVFLTIVGFIWYPVRRLLRSRKAGAATAAEATTAETPGQ